MHVQLGKILDKKENDQHPPTPAPATHCHFWRAGSKNGEKKKKSRKLQRKSQGLRMRPALNTAKG